MRVRCWDGKEKGLLQIAHGCGFERYAARLQYGIRQDNGRDAEMTAPVTSDNATRHHLTLLLPVLQYCTARSISNLECYVQGLLRTGYDSIA